MSTENLSEYIARKADQTPEKIYLTYEQQEITYRELKTRMIHTAKGLYEYGVKQDDKVCVMLENSPEYLDIWFGLSMIGAVLVPINTHLKGEGLRHIIDHSDSELIILEESFKEQVNQALKGIERPIDLVINDIEEKVNSDQPLSDILHNHSHTTLPKIDVPADSINNILYTSGTTGPPKGVMLTHENYIHAAAGFAHHMVGATEDDILFTTLPLFHINAQAHTVLGAIAVNATIALQKRFSASRFWQQVRDSRATIFNSLGSMIPILCKQPEHELDTVHNVRITACAATPKDFWKTFEDRFQLKIIEGYGLTETTGFCVTNPLDGGKIASIGQPYNYVEGKVVSETGHQLQPQEIGEFALKADSRYFMKGYYKMPEETKEAVKDQWFYTGDRVYADDDGYYYFCDRQAQVIRRRGENISSWEVEKVIDQHPAILESAAVGVPSELAEEDVKIFVVLKEGAEVTPERLMKWCEERLAYFMVPRYVEFIDELPKTATERIEKYKLREQGIGNAWDRETAGYQLKR